MKRIILFVLIIFSIVGLSGCYSPSEVHNYDYILIQDQIVNVIEENEKAVVQVRNLKNGAAQSTGSGVIYRRVDFTYYVITNHHVIKDADSIKIHIGSGNHLDGTLVGTDEKNDIAVVSFDYSFDLKTVETPNKIDLLKKGQIAIAIGTPISDSYFNTATFGIISAIRGSFVQHSAPINPGNSGGPLFNIQGRLIGINVSKIMTTVSSGDTVPVEGIGFAIHVDFVKTIFNEILENGSIERPVLGVNVTQISTYLADRNTNKEYIPADIQEGVIVITVEENSAALRGNIKAFDIIKSVNGTEITLLDNLRDVLNMSKKGDELTVVVTRLVEGNFQDITLVITL